MRKVFFSSFLALFLSIVSLRALEVEITPRQQAQLILRIVEQIRASRESVRILVVPRDDRRCKLVIDEINHEKELFIGGESFPVQAEIFTGQALESSDIVLLANENHRVVPGAINIAFNEAHVDEGAAVGIVQVRDRLVIFLNSSSAKKLGITFDFGLVKLSRIKSGSGL